MAIIPCGQCAEDCADTMNKRIKELAEQANLEIDPAHPDHNQKVLEKFAELIVKEVLDEVLQAMDDGMDVYDTVADKFGVEE
jgi:hypothetical protein